MKHNLSLLGSLILGLTGGVRPGAIHRSHEQMRPRAVGRDARASGRRQGISNRVDGAQQIIEDKPLPTNAYNVKLVLTRSKLTLRGRGRSWRHSPSWKTALPREMH